MLFIINFPAIGEWCETKKLIPEIKQNFRNLIYTIALFKIQVFLCNYLLTISVNLDYISPF